MADESTEVSGPGPSAAELAAAILDEEARRRAEQAERDAETVRPDDLLPGVGDAPMTLREGLRAGGKATVAMMFVLAFIDELPRAIRVLAPDIQDSLNVSDTVLFGILGFGGVTLVLGAVPMARSRRPGQAGGHHPGGFGLLGRHYVLERADRQSVSTVPHQRGNGFRAGLPDPGLHSLLVDTYPIQSRSRIFALEGLGRPAGQLLGPLAIGGLAAVVGGDDPWRAAFFAVAAAPLVAAAVAALVLREPVRGRYEKQAIFGDEQVEVDELPVSMGHRLRTAAQDQDLLLPVHRRGRARLRPDRHPHPVQPAVGGQVRHGALPAGSGRVAHLGGRPLSGCPSPAGSSTGASAATRAP